MKKIKVWAAFGAAIGCFFLASAFTPATVEEAAAESEIYYSLKEGEVAEVAYLFEEFAYVESVDLLNLNSNQIIQVTGETIHGEWAVSVVERQHPCGACYVSGPLSWEYFQLGPLCLRCPPVQSAPSP